jgi:ATP-dependent Clp protease ATP-binding subunit ClpA
MFNRFGEPARRAVIDAVSTAHAGPAREVTDEHLLLALVRQQHTRSSDLLAAAGVTEAAVHAAFRAAERKAGLSDAEVATLRGALGIDVDEVVNAVERSLGEHALAGGPRRRATRAAFATTAKAILTGALRESKALRDKELRDEHLLLAIAAHNGVAAGVLASHGLSYLDIRSRMAA